VYVPPKLDQRLPRRGAKPLSQQLGHPHMKPEDRLNSDACAILSLLRPENPIPSGKIERQLLKLKGVKEITINPISHTVKIRYDPHVMTAEKMRSAIRKLGRT